MPGGTDTSNVDDTARTVLQESLELEFKQPGLLDIALTHRSYAYEHDVAETNERLELLGDAVLNLVVTDIIFKLFPDYMEGDLAKVRASMVSTPPLAEVAAELGLDSAIRLGRGEELTGGREKPSILADALEALIGAVYLDAGMRATRRVVRKLFATRLKAIVGADVPKDAKTHLQEWVTRAYGELPRYQVSGQGPDHAKRFSADVFVAGELVGNGEGRSKKEAEQAAAAQALVRLEGEAVDEVIGDA